jgi:hypothetical protein
LRFVTDIPDASYPPDRIAQSADFLKSPSL